MVPFCGDAEGSVGAVAEADLPHLAVAAEGGGAEHGVDAALEVRRPPEGGVAGGGDEEALEVEGGEEGGVFRCLHPRLADEHRPPPPVLH